MPPQPHDTSAISGKSLILSEPLLPSMEVGSPAPRQRRVVRIKGIMWDKGPGSILLFNFHWNTVGCESKHSKSKAG